MYTGGTTGLPKGVLWRHEDIFFAAMGGGDALSLGDAISTPEELAGRVLRPGMTALPTSPFMHASAHWLAFTTLFGGGKVVVLPDGHFDPATTWDLIDRESVNVLVVVGDAMARPLIDELDAHPGRYDLSSVLAVGSGGAVLSPSTKRRLAELLPGRAVVDAFGSSETGQLGGQAPAGDPYGVPRLRVDERTDVLDDDLRPVIPGSGAGGAPGPQRPHPVGYLGDPDKSAATFVTAGGRRWALPGDQATVDPDGTIVVLGRGSLCINTGGEKVFPDEVEAVLKDAPRSATWSLWACPTSCSASASSPWWRRARAVRSTRHRCATTAAACWPGTRRRGRSWWPKRSCAPRAGSPTTAGRGFAADALAGS